MHVKFRLCLDDNNKRITKIFFVAEDGTLELITQMSGWIGLDFDNLPDDTVTKVADSVATKSNDSKYIE